MKEIFFAVPGDIKTQSGGYIYDRRLALELGLQGRSLTHLELGNSYPNPTNAHASHAALALLALPADSIVIIDGLALGAMDAEVVAGLKAQLVALVHHPLALEGDLDQTRRESLFNSERTNLRHAKRVIVPSPHTGQLLISDYSVSPDRITVARPGIDRPDGTASLRNPPLILSVGIQVPRKGHDVLLRALASIKQLRWHATIAGPALDADYASSLLGLAEELGLEERVTFAGLVSDDEISALYRSASLFALATRFEGYGMVFGEAMAHGLPIVSCAAGAVSETVPLAAARLVEPNNPPAFGAALAELLENHALRAELASASLEAGGNLISWEDSAALIGEMLDSLPAKNN
jgi:glycosyltransferase involved in cell wall biosynthesis